jgi:hypothetical protein
MDRVENVGDNAILVVMVPVGVDVAMMVEVGVNVGWAAAARSVKVLNNKAPRYPSMMIPAA